MNLSKSHKASILEDNTEKEKILSYQIAGEFVKETEESMIYDFTFIVSDHTDLRNKIKDLD